MLMYLLPAAALMYTIMSRSRTPAGVTTAVSALRGKDAARGVTMKCQEKYCPPPYQIQVDTPKNTLQRDDSLRIGLGTLPRGGEPHERRRLADGQSQASALVEPALFQVIDNGALGKVYDSLKAQYYKEAHEHPGVRLVAHTVS